MTNAQLLTHELNHRLAGNGYAAVEIQPSTTSTLPDGKKNHWVLVTDKWCKKGQAFLAARDYLEIHTQRQRDLVTKEWGAPEPIKLTDEELAKLAPWRDGLANGSLKVVSTRFERATA